MQIRSSYQIALVLAAVIGAAPSASYGQVGLDNVQRSDLQAAIQQILQNSGQQPTPPQGAPDIQSIQNLINNVSNPAQQNAQNVANAFSAALQQIKDSPGQRGLQEQQKQQQIDRASQLLQQLELLNRINQQTIQEKSRAAIELYLATLTEEQRRLFEQRSQAASVIAIEKAREKAGLDAPHWLDAYPFYRDAMGTGDLPSWEAMRVGYFGDVIGTAADDTAVTGNIALDIDVGESIYGTINFDRGAGSIGFHSDFSENIVGMTDPTGDDHFFGGTIASEQEGALLGTFYGPNGENAGGTWSFEVTGGEKPGTASGQFAAALTEPD